MRYTAFRDLIQQALRACPDGLTWVQLRDQLELPYERACPNWTKRLENEIGLTRMKAAGRALIWKVPVWL